jgi:UDP-2,3-diacylglucosamine hydrolase
MTDRKKIYFASDVHLGLYPYDKSREREKLFVKWLDGIKSDAKEIFLLGDIFDYWYEYKKVVPRGFTRTLSKIAEITESGIPVHFFTGNHDIWVFDYLPEETGVIVQKKNVIREFNGKRFYIGHGDNLDPKDIGYRLMNWLFKNKTAQFFFSKIHPNLTIGFGKAWSKKSRYSKGLAEEFKGDEHEHQIQFARRTLEKEEFDFFVFGHRHLPMDIKLNEKSRLINIGDWIFNFTYAVFDGENMSLNKYLP